MRRDTADFMGFMREQKSFCKEKTGGYCGYGAPRSAILYIAKKWDSGYTYGCKGNITLRKGQTYEE